MSEELSASIGAVVRAYTWLLVDALILFLILASMLAYNDFDKPMRIFIRGVFIAFWGHVWLSGLHLLIFLRRKSNNKEMPALASYTLFAGKLGLIVGTGYWAYQRGLL